MLLLYPFFPSSSFFFSPPKKQLGVVHSLGSWGSLGQGRPDAACMDDLCLGVCWCIGLLALVMVWQFCQFVSQYPRRILVHFLHLPPRALQASSGDS